jgi:hypothetical protein
MVILPLWDFGLLNQINGPSTSSSINDRDLLRDFGAFTLCFPPECSVPGVLDLVPHVHFQINYCRLLHDFDFQIFQILNFSFTLIPEYLLSEFTIFSHVPSGSNGPDSLRVFGSLTLRYFNSSALRLFDSSTL